MKYKELLKAMLVAKPVIIAFPVQRIKMVGTITAVRLVASRPDPRGHKKIKISAEVVTDEKNQVFVMAAEHVYDGGTDAAEIKKSFAPAKTERAKSFTPPTVEDVAAYCKERGNGIDADAFVSYYESIGWMVGKSKMKDWKAAVRTWEKRNKAEAQSGYHTPPAVLDDYEKKAFMALHREET